MRDSVSLIIPPSFVAPMASLTVGLLFLICLLHRGLFFVHVRKSVSLCV